MILNLETEKAVDSSKCLGIVSSYPQLRPELGILGFICDLAFQLLHGLYTWWHRGMDKHRNGEIALGELCRDHCQMLTNGLLLTASVGPLDSISIAPPSARRWKWWVVFSWLKPIP